MLSIFSCTKWPFVWLIWWNVYSHLLPTIKMCYLLSYWIIKYFKIYSGYKFLIRYWFASTFYWVLDCLFIFVMVSFEACFKFWWCPVYQFFLFGLCCTGSKLGKEYVKAVYCHPAYLTYRVKFWAGWSTTWNWDCFEKYQ